MISLEKWMILAPLQKLPKNVKDLDKLIGPKGIKKLPKVQKIANYGHTVSDALVLKAGSHYTANLLWPEMKSGVANNKIIFQLFAMQPSPLQQSLQPATSVNEALI